MFSRFHTTTLLIRSLVIVFGVTLFLDATDVIDLFSQKLVMHGDSDEDAQMVSSSVCVNLQLAAKAKSNIPLSRESRNVILDQDSPSLAADVLPISASTFQNSSDKLIALHPASRGSSSVRLCVLRI